MPMRSLATFALALLLASGARGQDWPTRQFAAFCFDGGAGGTWVVGDTRHIPPGGEGPCRGRFQEVADHVVDDLEASSEWLSGLGFPAPTLNRSGRQGPYTVVVGADTVLSDGDDLHGIYSSFDGGLIVFSSRILAESGPMRRNKRGTGTHELVHAIQASTPYWAAQRGDQDWIKEGTAQAVEVEWQRRHYGEGGLGPAGYVAHYVTHGFDRPLHLPDPQVTGEYSVAQFWLGIGEMIGAQDRIAYFREVYANASSGDYGISGVDRTLKAYDSAGLYGLYPRFIAYWTAGSNAQYDEVYDESVSEDAPLSLDSDDALEPLAAEAINLEVVAPEAGAYSLSLDLGDAPDNLHLIVGDEVAGRSAVVPIEGGATTTLRLRVANVGRDPAATPDTPWTLSADLFKTPDTAVGCECGGAVVFTLVDSGPVRASTTFTHALAGDTERLFGEDVVYHHGLLATRSGSDTKLMWSQQAEAESRQGLANSRRMIREMGWESLSGAEVQRRMMDLSPEQLSRYFPESDPAAGGGTVSEMLGSVLGDALNISLSDWMLSVHFTSSTGTSAMIMLPAASGVAAGVYGPDSGAGVSIQGVGANAQAGMQQGAQLYQPTVTLHDADPDGCVHGSFSGAYADASGDAREVSGTFLLSLPEGAEILDL